MSGPLDYNYLTKINDPTASGAITDGTLAALGKDVKVLLNYADILWNSSINNNSTLNTNNRSLGDAYFYKTDQQCKGTSENRYIYVDNVPKGVLNNAKGLLPGAIEDLGDLMPSRYLADLIPMQPECLSVSLEVIDDNNNAVIESHYMSLNDIRQIDACSFPDKINPAFDSSDPLHSCKQGFKNKKKKKTKQNINKYIYLIIFIIIIIFLVVRYH
jgi:hypothetical protein